MVSRIQAFPTTDGIFVVWEVSAMIPNCLGFALYRQQQGKSASVVDTWVGFEDQAQGHKNGEHRPSTEWPVQKTNWTDFLAPSDAPVRYGVVPVLKDGDSKVKPAANAPSTWSDYVSAMPTGPLKPWFNRGTISAQWLSRAIGQDRKPAQTLDKAISTKGNKIRDFLMGQLGARLLALLADARTKKRDVYLALYELNDPELIAALTALKGKAHVVLGNSTGKSDATAKDTEKSAGVLKKAGVDIVRRKIAEPLRPQQVRGVLRRRAKAAGGLDGQHQLDTHRTLCPEQQRARDHRPRDRRRLSRSLEDDLCGRQQVSEGIGDGGRSRLALHHRQVRYQCLVHADHQER